MPTIRELTKGPLPVWGSQEKRTRVKGLMKYLEPLKDGIKEIQYYSLTDKRGSRGTLGLKLIGAETGNIVIINPKLEKQGGGYTIYIGNCMAGQNFYRTIDVLNLKLIADILISLTPRQQFLGTRTRGGSRGNKGGRKKEPKNRFEEEAQNGIELTNIPDPDDSENHIVVEEVKKPTKIREKINTTTMQSGDIKITISSSTRSKRYEIKIQVG